MAYIKGNKSGLVPTNNPAPKTPRPPAIKKQHICHICGGTINVRKNNCFEMDEDEPTCMSCVSFFGLSEMGGGVTTDSPKDAKAKIERLREAKYALILKTQSFVSPSGIDFTVEIGDVFPVARIGSEMLDQTGTCEMARTKAMHTIELNIGGIMLTLYTHEFGVLTFTEIMMLRKEGELEDAFISADDKVGFFTPSAAVREVVHAQFVR